MQNFLVLPKEGCTSSTRFVSSKNHSCILKRPDSFGTYNQCQKDLFIAEIQTIKTVGIFNSYPIGVFNPALAKMNQWELYSTHELNDYQICQYHSIKSGVTSYGQ